MVLPPDIPLTRYESISKQGKFFSLVSTKEDPIFAYCLGKFVKVYRPKSKLCFLYGGEKVDDYVLGFEQLPGKGDMIFITGGEKDMLSLSAHGFNAICFNSETAQIPGNIIEGLLLRFQHLIILYDTDETGIREAKRQAEMLGQYKVLCLTLPLWGTKTEKDISDYFALGNGAEDMRALLSDIFTKMYAQTMMILQSCEIDYDNPPDASKSVVAVNGYHSARRTTFSASRVEKVRVKATIYLQFLRVHLAPNGYRLSKPWGWMLQPIPKAWQCFTMIRSNPRHNYTKTWVRLFGEPALSLCHNFTIRFTLHHSPAKTD